MLQGRSNVYRKGKKFHVLLMKDAGRAFVRNIALIPCNIYLFLFLLLFVFLLPKTNNKKTKTKQKSLHVSTFKFQTRNAAQDFFTVGFVFISSVNILRLSFLLLFSSGNNPHLGFFLCLVFSFHQNTVQFV